MIFSPFLGFAAKHVRKFKCFVVLVVFCGSYLSADTLSLSLAQNMTDNLFQNRYSEADQVANLSFSIDKDFTGFSLFAGGGYSHLFDNAQVAFTTLDLGLDHLHPLGAKTALYVSLIGSGTFYREEYRDFNYLDLNAFTALKSYVSQTSILKAQYSFIFRKYRAAIFDYWSHSLFLSLDKYFQSRTTVKGELNWGYKYFRQPYQEDVIESKPGMPAFQRGMGKGRPSGGDPLPPQPPESGGEGIQIASLSALLAQGIGSRVGLNVTATQQWVLSGKNPFDSVQEFYLVENPSYDRFSWEGYEIGSQLTVLMPWAVNLKIGYTYSHKTFPGIESFDLEDMPLGITRRDRRERIDVSLEKDFAQLSVFINYAFVDNRSNDPFFDWNGHFFSVGFTWNHFYGGKS